MDHYIDIRLRPDPEFAAHQLMSALFSKLHRALVQLGRRDIGVSFPQVQTEPPSLGACLRLHGDLPALQVLMGEDWLTGMHDHIQPSEPTAVPGKVTYREVRRVQAKSSPERARRRLIRRHGVGEDEALARIPDTLADTYLSLPFVQVQSRSTGQRFRLFIEHRESGVEPTPGAFNAYGLGQGSTVPWF